LERLARRTANGRACQPSADGTYMWKGENYPHLGGGGRTLLRKPFCINWTSRRSLSLLGIVIWSNEPRSNHHPRPGDASLYSSINGVSRSMHYTHALMALPTPSVKETVIDHDELNFVFDPLLDHCPIITEIILSCI
jgi:hypothetical protein